MSDENQNEDAPTQSLDRTGGDYSEFSIPASLVDSPVKQSTPLSPQARDLPTAFPRIDGYHIISKLGQGGMGTVYRASQLATRREVALKLMSVRALGSDKARRRFEREVELASSLEHPNIARVFDSGLAKNVYFYAMQLVPGVPLDRHVEMNQLDELAILDVFLKVCRAIEFAHRKGVIHRDLKPSNIMVTPAPESEPFVLDFGLAKTLMDDGEHLTVSQEGDLTGTPAYMSPEQASGHVRSIDTRTDVYALGVILFRLLTNDHPHDLTGSAFDLTKRIIELDPKRPRNIKANLDRDLEAILLKCLEKQPVQRYGSAGGLADDIQKYLNKEPISAQPATAGYFLKKKLARHKPLVALVATLFIIFNAAVLFYLMSIKAEQARTETARQEAISAEKQAEADRDKAKEEAKRAQVAEEVAESERDRASKEADAALKEGYFNKIGLAYRLHKEGDNTQALKLLNQCPESLRDWEWRFIRHLCSFPSRRLSGVDYKPVWCATAGTSQMLAAIDAKGNIQIWDQKTHQVIKQITMPSNSGTGVAISPDGTLLAATDELGNLQVWSTVTWGLATTYQGMRTGNSSNSIAFSHDSQRLAVPLNTAELLLFETKGWTMTKVKWSNRPFDDLAFHSNNKWLAAASLDGVVVWNLDSGSSIHNHVISGGAGSVSFNRAGNMLASGGNTGVRMHRIEDGRFHQVSFGDESPAHIVRFSPDDSHLAVCGYYGYLRVWNFESRRMQYVAKIGQSPTITFLSDGQLATASFTDSITLRHWHESNRTSTFHLGRYAAAFDPLARTLHVSSHSPLHQSPVVDKRWSLKLLTSVPNPSQFMIVSADGMTSVTGDTSRVRISASNKPTREILPESAASHGPSIDAKARLMVIGCNDGRLRIYDCDTGALLRTIVSHHRVAPAVDISADGKLVAVTRYTTAHADVYDIESGSLLWSSPPRTADGQLIRFSSDSMRLFTTVRQGVVHVWSMQSTKPEYSLIGHNDIVRDIAVTKNGTRLITLSYDGTMRVWDALDGREILAIEGVLGQPKVLQLLDGDSVLAVRSETDRPSEYLMQVWDMRDATLPLPETGWTTKKEGEESKLLPLVTPELDAVAGVWTLDGEHLEVASSHNARLQIPVRIRGSYEIRSAFTRFEGKNSIGFQLPIEGRRCRFFLSGELSNDVDRFGTGMLATGAEGDVVSVKPSTIVTGKRHEVTIRVTKGNDNHVAFHVELDGKKHLSWSGPIDAVQQDPGYPLPDPSAIGVDAWNSRVRFHEMTLKMLDGEAWVRSAAPVQKHDVIQPGVDVDVLAGLTSRNEVSGGKLTGIEGGIRLTSTATGKVITRVRPQGSYELDLTLSRESGTDLVAVFLPLGTRAVGLMFDVGPGRVGSPTAERTAAFSSGLETVGGKFVGAIGHPATVTGQALSPGKQHQVRIRVEAKGEAASIEVQLNGKAFLNWQGKKSELDLWPSWRTPRSDAIVLGCAIGSINFHSATLKMIDGEAWVWPAATPSVPTRSPNQ